MRILKCFSFACLITANNSSIAATEFEDFIPVEVVKALFGGQIEIYSDIMDEFPSFQMPATFSVIGSINQSSRLRVTLETQSDEDTAIDGIMNAFLLNEWVSMPSPIMPTAQTGFISANSSNTVRKFNQICHDQLGRISISYSQRSLVNYVSLSQSGGVFGGNQGTCAQQAAQQAASQARMSSRFGAAGGIRQYIPRMELPSVPQQRRAAFLRGSGGFSGSSTDIETESQLEIDWTTSEVYEHLAEQIAEQDWVLDSESSGNLSANGTWTRSLEADMNLIGTLTIVKTNDSNFQLKFRLISSAGNVSNSILRLR